MAGIWAASISASSNSGISWCSSTVTKNTFFAGGAEASFELRVILFGAIVTAIDYVQRDEMEVGYGVDYG